MLHYVKLANVSNIDCIITSTIAATPQVDDVDITPSFRYKI